MIPQRYVLGIMGFLALVNAYTMRTALSVAITEMVPPMPPTENPDACDVGDDYPTNSSTKREVSLFRKKKIK